MKVLTKLVATLAVYAAIVTGADLVFGTFAATMVGALGCVPLLLVLATFVLKPAPAPRRDDPPPIAGALVAAATGLAVVGMLSPKRPRRETARQRAEREARRLEAQVEGAVNVVSGTASFLGDAASTVVDGTADLLRRD